MSLRLIKIFLPLEHKTKADEILRECSIDNFWHDRISDKKVLIRALVLTEEVESFLDKMEEEFSNIEGFRTLILPVEASIPRIKKEDPKKDKNNKNKEEKNTTERISREELYATISGNTRPNITFFALMVLATIIGAIGLFQGNIPMVVGAMIIAPLLGPSVGLSLGTVLGDFSLTFQALKTLFLGVLTALLISLLVGAIFPIDPLSPEIALRTVPGLGDVLVSSSSGVVGVLSFTTGTLTSLAGVMVAVSLLPPLIVSGMMLGSGFLPEMTGAILLFLINLICINLAGVVTFLAQRISPRTDFESLKAKFLTILAVSVWFVLFLIAIITVLVI